MIPQSEPIPLPPNVINAITTASLMHRVPSFLFIGYRVTSFYKVSSLNDSLANKFAVVNGTLPATTGFGSLAYPSGFTKNNTVVIGFQNYVTSINVWVSMATTDLYVRLYDAQITINNYNAEYVGRQVKIMLMRTDI